ncbi:MAG: serine hydrolase [Anaerolineae bacterium]
MVTLDELRARLPAITEWLQSEIDAGHTPGAAVGILLNGEVVYTGGFGLRDVARGLPVDADTLFAIGSCSKAFTAFGAGMLVDEGKLTWDTPLRDLLPDFRLYDPIATQLSTVRDLLCHRTGLPRHDFMWYGSDATREELYARLRYLKPSATFREKFQYQNLMFMTMGYAVGKTAGTTWEAFTQARIFEPLGMERTQFSVAESEKDVNAALPYEFRKAANAHEAVPFRNINAVGPAGSINSNINDMLRWLRLNMVGNPELIKEATLRELHTTQVVIPPSPEYPWYGTTDITNTGYALGWATLVYRGMTMVRHAGGIDGFNSSVAFFPDSGLGVVALCNAQERDPASALTYGLFDRALGLEPIPWWDKFAANREKLEAMGAAQKQAFMDAQQDAKPSHPLEAYAGIYRDAGYGDFTISADGDRLKAVFNGLTLHLIPHHFDTFRIEVEGADMMLIGTFTADARGNVARFETALEGAVDPIPFIRVNA